MIDIAGIAQNVLDELISTGALAEKIKNEIEKTITSAVTSAFSYNSNFRKEVERAIIEATHVDLKGIGIAGYNDLVLKVLERQLEAAYVDVVNQRVKDQMAALLITPPPQIKLSELVEAFKKFSQEDIQMRVALEREFTRPPYTVYLAVEQTYPDDGVLKNYYTVSLDVKKPQGKYDRHACAFTLELNMAEDKQCIHRLQIGHKDMENTLFVGRLDDFEKYLFQLYSAGTKIVLDEDDCVLEFWPEGEGDDC